MASPSRIRSELRAEDVTDRLDGLLREIRARKGEANVYSVDQLAVSLNVPEANLHDIPAARRPFLPKPMLTWQKDPGRIREHLHAGYSIVPLRVWITGIVENADLRFLNSKLSNSSLAMRPGAPAVMDAAVRLLDFMSVPELHQWQSVSPSRNAVLHTSFSTMRMPFAPLRCYSGPSLFDNSEMRDPLQQYLPLDGTALQPGDMVLQEVFVGRRPANPATADPVGTEFEQPVLILDPPSTLPATSSPPAVMSLPWPMNLTNFDPMDEQFLQTIAFWRRRLYLARRAEAIRRLIGMLPEDFPYLLDVLECIRTIRSHPDDTTYDNLIHTIMRNQLLGEDEMSREGWLDFYTYIARQVHQWEREVIQAEQSGRPDPGFPEDVFPPL
ncbi:hypothetical protein BV25DRAFT_1912311 [Artomyces pyxidatus]|uniref:Uncharacterized protein n=1 Tax=Artomyces pyxidatus TaxID=48021 RepID=A0ACB8TEW8_9AGAM|nr:hypothetical protein BV25DRAFT_1912311 [Artomyces pyxidatus]